MEILEQQEVKQPSSDQILSIDEPPFYEEWLALEWTLSIGDIRLIATSVKGEKQALYFAAMLKSLRNTGDFLNEKTPLPDKILDYLSKQLNIAKTKLTPVSRNSQKTYTQTIKKYLGYREYTASEENVLKDYILCEMQKELFSIDSLKAKSCEFLKAHKIMRPPATVFDRAIASFRKKSHELLYEKLASETPRAYARGIFCFELRSLNR